MSNAPHRGITYEGHYMTTSNINEAVPLAKAERIVFPVKTNETNHSIAEAAPGKHKALADTDDLAAEIRQAHEELYGSFRITLDKAIGVGQLLLQAKTKILRKNWTNWLESKTGLNKRTAVCSTALPPGSSTTPRTR